MKKFFALALVVVMMLSFVACTKKAEFFEENLKDADYLVKTVEGDEDDDIEYSVVATKLTETVTVTCYADKDDAKKAEEEANDSILKMFVERKGRIVIVASSEDAYNDAYGK